jgi:hypothetical protein
MIRSIMSTLAENRPPLLTENRPPALSRCSRRVDERRLDVGRLDERGLALRAGGRSRPLLSAYAVVEDAVEGGGSEHGVAEDSPH